MHKNFASFSMSCVLPNSDKWIAGMKYKGFCALCFLIIQIALASNAMAGVTAGYSEFYIPGDEESLMIVMDEIGTGDQTSSGMHTIINIVAWSDDTIVYYDHWEDGYDFDPDNPEVTYDQKETLANKGDKFTFESSNIPTNPRGTGTYYDGGDRIYVVGGSATVTRASWTEATGTVLAAAWEVYPVRPQLTTYIIPFGEDLAASSGLNDFDRVFALIQATEDNTVLTFDTDADGALGDAICLSRDAEPPGGLAACSTSTVTQVTLNSGESFLLDQDVIGTLLQTGTKIEGSKTLQVQYVIGEENSGYEIRGLSAFPRGFWDDEYYAPVDSDIGMDTPTDIFLHNPHNTTLTIDYETTNGTGNFTIPPKGSVSFRERTGNYVPTDSAAFLKGSDVFWGVSTIDTEGQNYDWGYSLVPAFLLENEHFMGWAPGAFPPNSGGNADDSGIFISPAQDNVRIFIDLDNDGTPDQTYDMDRLETQYVYDPNDGDMSNANIYGTGPYTVAYGQNPDTAVVSSPAIDVGYTTIPGADFIEKVLTVDKASDPVVIPPAAGSSVVYELEIDTYSFSINGVNVVDTLPAGWEYVPGSTTITLADLTTINTEPVISGGGSVLTWDSAVLADMAENQTIIIRFTAQTTQDFNNGDITRNDVEVCATRTVGEFPNDVTQTFCTTDYVFNIFASMEVAKTSDAVEPLTPGDQYTYTVTVINPATSTIDLTGFSIYDPIPDGVGYVSGSAYVDAPGPSTSLQVLDTFTDSSFSNQDGTDSWASDWIEGDEYLAGIGPATGRVSISGGELLLENYAGGYDNNNDPSASRSVNLSAYSRATLRYDYSTSGIMEDTDEAVLEISSNGGADFTVLGQYFGTLSGATATHNISSYISANTVIRFRLADYYGGAGEVLHIDNVEIIASSGDGPAHDPPNFISAEDGYRLAPGETLTLTFDVKVDEPLATGIDSITNTAFVTTNETLLPISDEVTLTVVNPSAASGEVGDRIWFDTDGDGIQDAGEPGLANVEVTLRDQYYTPVAVTTTDGLGYFLFDDVEPDSCSNSFYTDEASCLAASEVWTWNGYYVEVTGGLPAGLEQSAPAGHTPPNQDDQTDPFDLLPGTSYLNADIGYTGEAPIGDRIWSDADGDGFADVGEPGIGGVDIELWEDIDGDGVFEPSGDDSGGLIDHATSAADGSYLFTGITASGTEDYFVYVDESQAALSGYTRTTVGNILSVVDASPDTAYLDKDFGYQGVTYTITNRIWFDADEDGDDDAAADDNGENGIANVTVDLVNASNAVIATVSTNSDGYFSFTGVPGGGADYMLRITDTNGILTDYFATTTGAGSGEIAVVNMTGDLDYGAEPGEPSFGFSLNASIGDLVFNDLDGDGVRDAGEPGLPGVTVELRQGGATIASVSTDANGNYLFSGLSDGIYEVFIDGAQTALSGYSVTTPSGAPSLTRSVTITGGGNVLDIDFGFQAADNRTVSGNIWDDTDGEGDLDEIGNGISDVTFDIYLDDGDGVFEPGTDDGNRVAWVTSDGNGDYSFTGLPSGQYFVQITDALGSLDGYDPTFERTEGVGAGAFDGYELVNLTAGDVTGLDFGYDRSAVLTPDRMAIGDFIWLDADGDGVQDIGEPGLPNVSVGLYADDGTLLETAVTDLYGGYLFTEVPVGDYYVEVDEGTLSGNSGDFTLSPGAVNPTAIFALAASVDNLDADFGYTNTNGVIGDFIWSDADGNGRQDPGEPGIDGVTVTLLNADGTMVATTATEADGHYFFTGVTAGEYRVSVNVPAGYTLISSGPQTNASPSVPITLEAGGIYLNADFGLQGSGLNTVSDRIWHDANRDGVADAGETGIGGVTVSLFADADGDGLIDAGESIIATAITDANGDFTFSDVPDGNYVIGIGDSGGALADFDGTTADAVVGYRPLTGLSGNVSGTNFGYGRVGAIGNTVFSDADSDGIQDLGEAGISGREVELWLDDGDGVFGSAGDTLVSTQTTDAGGNYLFESLSTADQTYFISIGAAETVGYSYTSGAIVPDDDANGANGIQAEITLSAAAPSALNTDFGFFQDLSDISGSVWDDLDGDGIDDGAGEPPIAGVTVALVNGVGEVVATAESDASGAYAFPDIPNGSYSVRITDQNAVLTGYSLTSGLDEISLTVTGTDIDNVDFGYTRSSETGRIGNLVWLDADRDGVKDGGENGLSGIDVQLYRDDGDGNFDAGDTDLGTVTTDSRGGYSFDGLPAGSYFVDIVGGLPSGLTLTTTAPTDSASLIVLSQGEIFEDADVGYAAVSGASSIGDRVWHDVNGNLIQDSGEPGIGGVTVTVTPPAGVDIGNGADNPVSVVTDEDGSWFLAGLPAGDYTVSINTGTLPAGYNPTPINGDATRIYTVPANTDTLYADFAFQGDGTGSAPTASIGNTVFRDADGDGIQDGTEPGISGVTLDLLDSGGNIVASALTDENGSYDFTGLPAGDYTIAVTDYHGALDGMNITSAITNPTATITLGAGQDYNAANFPYKSGTGGVIGDLIWHDLNGDGDRDAGESGLEGVTVRLWADTNGNGAYDAGVDNLVRTSVTDANGEYTFLGLPDGAYLVDVLGSSAVLSGFSKTSGSAGVDNNSQADPYPISISGGVGTNAADFGYAADTPLEISGSVFIDGDVDGFRKSSEIGAENATVKIHRDLDGDGVLDPEDPLVGETLSDADGQYAFGDLPDGVAFIVQVDVDDTYIEGYSQTTQAATAAVQPVLLSGADSTGNDFGFTSPRPTLVIVSSFRAYEDQGRVVTEWETASENRTLGFYLSRENDAGDFIRLNGRLLPGLLHAPQGGVYRYVDETAEPGKIHSWRLEEVDASGKTNMYGPFTGIVEKPSANNISMPAGTRYARTPHGVSDAEKERSANSNTSRRKALDGAAPEPGDYGRIPIAEDGLYFVSADRIAGILGLASGEVRNHIAAANLRLTNLGRDIAWMAADDDSGIHFYGEAPEDIYSAENIYRLDVAEGSRMTSQSVKGNVNGDEATDIADAILALKVLAGVATPDVREDYVRSAVDVNDNGKVDMAEPLYILGRVAGIAGRGAASPSAAENTFLREIHVEENKLAAPAFFTDPEADYWMWEVVLAGYPDYESKSFTVRTPAVDPNGGAAKLVVQLTGNSDTAAAPDHHAVIRVNGTEVGDGRHDGSGPFEIETTFDASLLDDGDNTVTVTGLLDTGAPYSYFYVDSFRIGYRSYYRAENNRLFFRADGNRAVSITGFTDPDIMVLDISDPLKPQIAEFLIGDGGGGEYRVDVAPSSPDAVLLAVGTSRIAAVTGMEAGKTVHLSDSEGAEYVIITTEALSEAARELADHRERQGMSTMVVNISDIMDEFNGGLSSPWAIRDFLMHAWYHWSVPPRYCVLAGAGTYDYKNYSGVGGNLIPALMVSTPYGLFGSDNRLADIEGDDGAPEIMIGRIPVLTGTELAAYIDKLKAFENTPDTSWCGRILMLADRPDPGAGIFPADSDALSLIPTSEYAVEKIYLADLGIAQTRQRILEGIDAGAGLINYFGHGGMDDIGSGGAKMLSTDDLNLITNASRIPMMNLMTCMSGRFETPGKECLAELLVIKPDGGAAAVWSPTGLSENPEARVLGDAFFKNVFEHDERVVGVAVRNALRSYAEIRGVKFMAEIFNLLGDPAFEMKKP